MLSLRCHAERSKASLLKAAAYFAQGDTTLFTGFAGETA